MLKIEHTNQCDVPKKDIYWQFIRGVFILAVIMIHCPNGLNYSSIEQNCWLIFRQIINFPVALFIFMAGYFVNAEKIGENYYTYLINRGGAY